MTLLRIKNTHDNYYYTVIRQYILYMGVRYYYYVVYRRCRRVARVDGKSHGSCENHRTVRSRAANETFYILCAFDRISIPYNNTIEKMFVSVLGKKRIQFFIFFCRITYIKTNK